MKKNRCLFLIATLGLLFISCTPGMIKNFDPYAGSYKREYRNEIFKEKRQLKDFSSLHNPFVLSMALMDFSHPFGDKDKGNRRVEDGSLYVVFDLDNNTIFDACYTDTITASTRAIEGRNSKYFIASNNLISTFDSKNTKTTTTSFGEASNWYSADSYKANNDYVLVRTDTTNTRDGYNTYHFINTKDTSKSVSTSFKCIYTYNSLRDIPQDEDGFWYEEEITDDICNIRKIGIIDGKLKNDVLTTFPVNRNDNKYYPLFTAHDVLGKIGDFIVVSEYVCNEDEEYEQQHNKAECNLILFNEKDKTSKTFSIPCPDNKDYQNKIYWVGSFNNNLYVLSASPNKDCKVQLNKIDKDGVHLTMDTKKIDYYYYFFQKGNKLYMMNIGYEKIEYRYIELDKGICSKPYIITTNDIYRQCY